MPLYYLFFLLLFIRPPFFHSCFLFFLSLCVWSVAPATAQTIKKKRIFHRQSTTISSGAVQKNPDITKQKKKEGNVQCRRNHTISLRKFVHVSCSLFCFLFLFLRLSSIHRNSEVPRKPKIHYIHRQTIEIIHSPRNRNFKTHRWRWMTQMFSSQIDHKCVTMIFQKNFKNKGRQMKI